MHVVAVEEHLALPDLVRDLDPAAIAARGWPGPDDRPPEMAHLADPAAAPLFARRYDDRVAALVRGRRDRFATLAHLPVTVPEAAADDLERAVRHLGFRAAS